MEIGPIDYLVIEMPEENIDGSGLAALVDLVDRGLIRVLDLAFVRKGDDGSVAVLDLSALGATFEVFEGASSGMLGEDDVHEAAGALQSGTVGAVLVFENVWAAPFVTALRRNGAELVASGRIPADVVEAALVAAEIGD